MTLRRAPSWTGSAHIAPCFVVPIADSNTAPAEPGHAAHDTEQASSSRPYRSSFSGISRNNPQTVAQSRRGWAVLFLGHPLRVPMELLAKERKWQWFAAEIGAGGAIS